MQSKLKEFIRRLVQQQLKEMSTSAAAGPYATPYAFQDPKIIMRGKKMIACQQNKS